MLSNLILNTDSYKSSHFLQYPKGTTHVSSYIESRGGEYEKSLFFGLQAFLKEYLLKPINDKDIEEADAFLKAHGMPFYREGWEYILKAHKGFLPLKIEAIPEGTILPVKNVLVQLVNTDPVCFWLTSYVETVLLRAIWYPTTVATRSWYCKQVIKEFLVATAGSTAGLEFKLHDFGARGASSFETASLGGVAHLVNFKGSDTISGILAARKYYNEPMAAFSIPAAEHTTITAWGRDQEQQAYENMLNKFAGPGKMIAVVSDSYDLWNAISKIWGENLREKVVKSGGVVVIRPDSGNPVEEIVPKAIEMLMLKFGHTLNSKGYKVLPSYLRVIQGDGISFRTIKLILQAMKAKGISAENIAFGMGAELLQKLNRDTMAFAMKANAVMIDDKWHDIYKSPLTDNGKNSKPGRLALVKDGNDFCTIKLEGLGGRENLLKPVFENGKILKDWSFQEIRQRSESF
jgi:nicotinamide phosphoribosyltransferase